MGIWYRGAALAGGALLLAAAHTGAQIREEVGGPPASGQRPGLVERQGHPEVLLNTRDPEFVGGERVIVQFMLTQLDPKAAVGKINPPKGIDGIIAYPGSRMLMVRGTKGAVAGYRAALEKLDRGTSDARTAGETVSGALPEIEVAAKGKLALIADHLTRDGAVTHATGHVVISFADGVELRAQSVRVITAGGKRRVVIEK